MGQLFTVDAHYRTPTSQNADERWLVPVVGGRSDSLPPLLLWWILLFGLSLLARYEPAAWRAALDLDESPVALPLSDLLDNALVIVPELLYTAATAPFGVPNPTFQRHRPTAGPGSRHSAKPSQKDGPST